MSDGRIFTTLLRRQLALTLRRPAQLLNPLLFFALVVVLFPLGLGPQSETLSAFAPGILWIIALLANLLGVETLFRGDYDDGSIDQLLLSTGPLYFCVLPYVLVHWLLTGALLAIVSPLFALMLGLQGSGIGVLVASLFIGAGIMSILGAVGAALTVGLRRGGMLIALLITPFYMPVLIFGTGAVRAAVGGLAVGPYLALLGAMLALALALGPLAIGAALRISAEG